MRSFLLKNLDEIRDLLKSPIFYLLSLHCLLMNIFTLKRMKRAHQIKELQANISQTFMQSEQPKAIKILCLACYRPLHQYDWCQKLKGLDDLEEVNARLIEEPLLEKRITHEFLYWKKYQTMFHLKLGNSMKRALSTMSKN